MEDLNSIIFLNFQKVLQVAGLELTTSCAAEEASYASRPTKL